MPTPFMSPARAYEALGSSVVVSSGEDLKSVHATRNPEWFGLDADGNNPAVMVDRAWKKTTVAGKMLIEVDPRSWQPDTKLRQKKTERLLEFLKSYSGKTVGLVFAEYPPDREGAASKIAPRPDLVAVVGESNESEVFILEVSKRQ